MEFNLLKVIKCVNVSILKVSLSNPKPTFAHIYNTSFKFK